MQSKTIYFIEPSPNGDYLLYLAQKLSSDGYILSYTEKEIFLMTETKQMLLEKGTSSILSQQLLTEEVLPDSTPRNAVLDTLKCMLNRCAPKQSLHIIDPYLYPTNCDCDYIAFFVQIFESAINNCSYIKICTLPKRNKELEQQIKDQIKRMNSQISIENKYSDVFHDRFWIADSERGVFVGTSLNGIGRRYAVIDYLQKTDAEEIVKRYNQIP